LSVPLGEGSRDGGRSTGRVRPVVVVLAPRWSGDGEAAWFTRQVARALRRQGDVHVITLEGAEPGTAADRVGAEGGGDARCTIHRLAVTPATWHVARREVLLAALTAVEARSGRPNGASVERLLRRGTDEAWESADQLVAGLRPDLVVVAGYRQLGAWELCRRIAPAVPRVLVPLADTNPAVGLSHFDPMFADATATLVATGSEHRAVTVGRRDPGRVHVVGLPAVTDTDGAHGQSERSGVVVFTGHRAGDHDLPAALARLVALALPRVGLTVVSTDVLTTWSGGVSAQSALPRGSRATRELLSASRVTVDLRPGELLARRCIDSLVCGTPIVVPADSRGRQYAESGGCGLWFSPPGELIWCLEALADPGVSDRLGAQGQDYVKSALGTASDFAGRVSAVVGREMAG